MRDWPTWAQFTLSLGVVTLALLVRWLLTPVLRDQLPFVTVFSVLLPLVLVVRPVPFVAGAVLALAGAWYLLVPPAFSFRLVGPAVELQIALFALAIIAATVTAWVAHRAHQRTRSADARVERALRQRGRALRHRTAQLETIIDRAPLGVYLIDADFRFAKVNPIALPVFGDIPGGVLGREFDEIIHVLWEKDYADEIVRIFRHTLRTGESYVAPERAKYRIDRQKTEYYEWRLDRITLPDGRYGLVCYFRDISQQVEARKLIEQSRDGLREQGRQKDEFLATLAHELRNPLASLTTAVELLDRPGGTEADAAEALAIIRRQSRHMARLIDDLLDVSRIARGRMVLQRERVELAPLCRRVIADISPLYEDRQHEITLSLPDERPWVDADPARLTQILGNLLHNACKYTPAGGHITLSTRRDGKDVLIAVSDDGIGIAGEDLPRLFEPFAQINGQPQLAQGGLGLGLSVVRRLVEMHGGTVEARSSGRGRGSSFELRLPGLDVAHAPETPPASVVPSDPPPASVAPRNRRILVVDDNKDAAASLARLLTLGGDRTRIAHDGPEAIEAADDFEPDVVLLDIGLPSISGYDVCRTIRARPSRRKPVIVALTGWGQDEDRRKSAEAGFDHHLVKPVQFEKLDALLDALIAGSTSPHE